jgi:drug/metabolite transporter (DMT)-like permease
MKPLGILGVILVIAGIVILAMRGFSYTKDKDTVSVGPLSVSAEEKGFVSPAVGAVAVVAGLVLVAVSRRRA